MDDYVKIEVTGTLSRTGKTVWLGVYTARDFSDESTNKVLTYIIEKYSICTADYDDFGFEVIQ